MKKETYLRICYWWGAIADALLGIEMFFSAFLGSNSPFTGFGMQSMVVPSTDML